MFVSVGKGVTTRSLFKVRRAMFENPYRHVYPCVATEDLGNHEQHKSDGKETEHGLVTYRRVRGGKEIPLDSKKPEDEIQNFKPFNKVA